MKYIFRYTILNHYTLDQHIAREDLDSAIDSSFPYKDKLDNLIELFKEIIEELIHSKQPEKVQSIIQNNLQEEYPGDYHELASVWENQRHQVYGRICADCNQTSPSFNKINWSVSTPISTKYNSDKEMMANVKITTIKPNKEKCVGFLELNKKDLGMVKESLSSAIEFLDRALIES